MIINKKHAPLLTLTILSFAAAFFLLFNDASIYGSIYFIVSFIGLGFVFLSSLYAGLLFHNLIHSRKGTLILIAISVILFFLLYRSYSAMVYYYLLINNIVTGLLYLPFKLDIDASGERNIEKIFIKFFMSSLFSIILFAILMLSRIFFE